MNLATLTYAVAAEVRARGQLMAEHIENERAAAESPAQLAALRRQAEEWGEDALARANAVLRNEDEATAADRLVAMPDLLEAVAWLSHRELPRETFDAVRTVALGMPSTWHRVFLAKYLWSGPEEALRITAATIARVEPTTELFLSVACTPALSCYQTAPDALAWEVQQRAPAVGGSLAQLTPAPPASPPGAPREGRPKAR